LLRLIVLSFFAFSSDSINDYNRYLPQFEESVKMLQPGDIAASELYQNHRELETQSQTSITMR
jgi:hypothetical protein